MSSPASRLRMSAVRTSFSAISSSVFFRRSMEPLRSTPKIPSSDSLLTSFGMQDMAPSANPRLLFS